MIHKDELAPLLYAFDLQGYVVIDEALDSSLLQRIEAALPRYQAEAEAERHTPMREHISVKQDGKEIKLVDIVQHDADIRQLITNPRILPLVDAIVPNMRFKSSWLDFKWPGAGTKHHSNHTPYDSADHYTFHHGRPCAQTVTISYALQDIAAEDGALEVIPGSHKGNYPLPVKAVANQFRIKLPLKKGQAVLFTHNLNHGSFNAGTGIRRALFTSFCSGTLANSYGGDGLYDDLRAQTQPGSWEEWLLRRPHGSHNSIKRPPGPVPGAAE